MATVALYHDMSGIGQLFTISRARSYDSDSE